MYDVLIKKYGENNERVKHTIGVKNMAIQLAELYNVDTKKAEIAALFHDYYRYDEEEILISKMAKDDYEKYKDKKYMYHGLAAGNDIINYGINNYDISNAIKFHTTGRKNMSMLEKIIFVSDFAEQNRTHEGSKEVRELAYKNLNEAVCLTYYYMYKHLNDEEIKELLNYYKEKKEMDLLKVVVKTLDDLNFDNINIYDMGETSPLFDYVVIATAKNNPQANAAVRDLKQNTDAAGFEIRGIEGNELSWTLIDCKTIVIHIFDEDTRNHYGLDKIYSPFKAVEVKDVL